MRSLDAILFDLGGTLDGRGSWRQRFHRLFVEAGLERSMADRDRAFDDAEERSHATGEMPEACLRDMLQRHVGWQLESMSAGDPALAARIVDRFAREVAEAAAVNRKILAQLAADGYRMGVVSNACGNAARLCDEYGYSSFLSVVVDSHIFGRDKPDPAIFRHALDTIGTPPQRTAYVGDSLDRDVQPAKALGMRTFWVGGNRTSDSDRVADVIISTVADLPAHLRPRPTRAGIFAAGVGARLGALAERAKGLTPIAGRPLVDWTLDELETAGVSEIVMIVNEQSTALGEHAAGRGGVRVIVETTPSSMHSFLRVMETLAADGEDGPFLISTVDTIAPAGTFGAFVDLAARTPEADIVLALTRRIEDEHPLRVDVGADGRVVAIGHGAFATAGYYLVRSTILAEAGRCRDANLTALRQFFRHLFDRNYRLSGICMPDSIDVDRPEDIAAAERLLRAGPS